MPKNNYGAKAPFKMKSSPAKFSGIRGVMGGSRGNRGDIGGWMRNRRASGGRGLFGLRKPYGSTGISTGVGVPGGVIGSIGSIGSLWNRGGAGVGGWRNTARDVLHRKRTSNN